VASALPQGDTNATPRNVRGAEGDRSKTTTVSTVTASAPRNRERFLMTEATDLHDQRYRNPRPESKGVLR
jgi:hypothetical protein